MTSHVRWRRGSAGFTIIELMVTVAVVVILVSLAAPGFRQMIENQRLKAIHQQAVTDLQFARSEAVRLGIPVHFRAMSASGPNPACYVIFSDTSLVTPYSTACDCTLPAGARCTDAVNTRELKTVIVESREGVQFTLGATQRLPFDPYNGSMLVPRVDRAARLPARFQIDSSLDASRSIRTIVEYSGRPTTCIPSGSTVSSFGVPAC